MTAIFAAFFVYFAILLTLGLIFHRRQTSDTEFILGNRSLNFWLVALSAHASDMSAWLFMAFPMTIFVMGMSRAWIGLGLLLGMFFNWQFVAPKLRRMTERYHAYTLASFFEKRFSDRSGMIRLLSAVMMLIFLTHYLSAGMIAMGMLFESAFGVPYLLGIAIALIVAVIYTMVGGYVTVAWTDLFQGIFLLFMVCLVPTVAFFALPNGFATIRAAATEKQISLSILSIDSFANLYTIVFLALGWGLGYFGMPHVLTKFMGLRDPNEMYKSKWVGTLWQLIALSAAAFVGVVGIGFFSHLANPELVFIEMTKALFHPFFAGLILCGILAANMSTMDSQILVCASVMSEDLYKRWWRPAAKEETLLRVSRIGVGIVALVAFLLAMNQNATVLGTVLYSWSGLGSSFGPLVLMSLYYGKTTRFGAIAGILTGGIVVLIWPSLNPYLFSLEVLPMVPGFSCSLLMIWLFSKWGTETARASIEAEV